MRPRPVRVALPLAAAAIVCLGLLPLLAGPATLFASWDVVSLRIEAPLEQLFAQAKSQPDYAVSGTLTVTSDGPDGTPLPVTLSLRGHTSRRETECTFPKLKVDLRGASVDTGVLAGMKTLRIGTHCGESEDGALTQRFGRLPNERSPLREVATYRLLDALHVPALRARPARITYVSSDARAGQGGAPAPIVRHAMLLEGDDAAIRRLGGRGEIEASRFTTADQLFSSADAANLAFAEALIGNFDWCVKFSARDTYRCDARTKLWNVIAVAMDNGKARPIMYDFDVSGMVTGSHRWFDTVFDEAFVPSRSHREVEVIAQLQRTRTLFPRAELDAARKRFMTYKGGAYRALEQAELDADGRRQMREYLDAFYREIESDAAFYRPVVVAPNTIARAEPSASAAPACATGGPMPVGTPVSDPIDTRGGMIHVVALDALWHWAPPARCAAMQNGTVWIEADAVSREFPR